MKMNDDYLSYQVPEQWRNSPGIRSLYPPIPVKTGAVSFDIYDFEMLFNDEATKGLIRNGKSIGCFYIESPGMRALLRKLEVETFEMLTAASSIIRPGVAESGMMQEFIARHKDPSRRKYLVPEMEELLADTYGVMIYQEDVIKVAHYIAGLTLEEADLLRRAMSGKMRSYKAMEAITEKFFVSCKKRNLTDYQAKELWRQIESFAGYSFCKAHSASFALLSFQVAYLKAHHPAEFLGGVLSNGGGFYAPAVYIQEAVRLGIKIKLPCINNSVYEYAGSDKEIRIGLMAIKNLTRNTIEKIIAERERNGKYMSLADFVYRTGTGIEESAMLIKCGAMDCFKVSRPYLLRLLDIYIKRRKLLDENYYDLFMGEVFSLEEQIGTLRNFSMEEICRYEYEAFDYMVTRHPLYFFREDTENPYIIKASEMEYYKGKQVKMIGWYMASKRIKTKKGTIMKFLSLEDLTGTFEAVIFPRVYEMNAEKTMSMGPYLLEGKVDPADSNNLVVERLEILASMRIKSTLQRDSVENNYFGDVEKISEEEFSIVQNLDKDKLLRAYAG
jgi:DNA polymerase III alpha subunit